MKNNKEGRKLTTDILKERGFKKNITEDRDGDEIKIWSNKNGIHLHEDSWWIKNGKSCYKKGEREPEITFNFATYVRGNGGFKAGFGIETDNQLDNLIYALTSEKQ